MIQPVVIYDSKYGSTKRYAQWIAEALSCPVFAREKFNPKDFPRYQAVIYGGGLYAGNIRGIRLLSKNARLLQGKPVILFTCGLSDPENEGTSAAIRQSLSRSLPPALLSQTRLFPLRGSIDYARLTPLHRAMMAAFHKMVKNNVKKSPASLTEEDRGILETYEKSVDFVNRESLKPLLSYCAAL